MGLIFFPGRDSVLAQERKHEINSDAFYVTPEQRDADLISRIEKQLTSSRTPYNIEKLRNACQKKDNDKIGKVRNIEVIAKISSFKCNKPTKNPQLSLK